MPYIKPKRRIEMEKTTDNYDGFAIGMSAHNAGELNYQLTNVILGYLSNKADIEGRENNYSDFNDVIGALESCKLEFYRRIMLPYEDKKIKENGDVY